LCNDNVITKYDRRRPEDQGWLPSAPLDMKYEI